MDIDVPLWRNTSNLYNDDPKPIFVIKASMTSFFQLRKVTIEIIVTEITEIIFWWKGLWIGSLYLPDG